MQGVTRRRRKHECRESITSEIRGFEPQVSAVVDSGSIELDAYSIDIGAKPSTHPRWDSASPPAKAPRTPVPTDPSTNPVDQPTDLLAIRPAHTT
jgi:hypothetical protein